ncbi:hypothetical protein Z946_3810 [Sulfitobacter noctilucicola]|uniref:Uncharacterized protein n=1 Tax=Sulfitobacter noctilucicola TaxID=1342301 RepID=A0A7W6M8B0_9RHOB|nr:hypothetical protein [Sulfitobacter noctilucicola]KIN64916.1 hypothetical protein Z946_3810 [Sulfitobacter noctilucicola]MBB4173943.1 hypothetical protein [Sulfitobacter noctilucicola]
MTKAANLLDMFRNGNMRSVVEEVICDGPRALELAALLAPDELRRLIRVVDAHIGAE